MSFAVWCTVMVLYCGYLEVLTTQHVSWISGTSLLTNKRKFFAKKKEICKSAAFHLPISLKLPSPNEHCKAFHQKCRDILEMAMTIVLCTSQVHPLFTHMLQ